MSGKKKSDISKDQALSDEQMEAVVGGLSPTKKLSPSKGASASFAASASFGASASAPGGFGVLGSGIG